MSSYPVIPLSNNNNQYLTLGPITDAVTGATVTDLTITASLWKGRDLSNPIVTPGTKVAEFDDPVIPHIGGGVYRKLIPAFNIAAGQYVLVHDAPASPTGYQLHRERMVTVGTSQG